MKQRIKKAVIPAAGAGSRMFPLTKVFRKEFFPVPDSSGKLVPIIESIVREALSGGIEKIALLIQKEDMDIFRQYFHEPLKGSLAEKLSSREFKEYDQSITNLGSHIDLIPMTGYDGFGYAVSFAKDWVGYDDFLLLLGDHFYFSYSEESCTQQLLSVSNLVDGCGIGITRLRESKIKQYGIIKTAKRDEHERLYSVQSIFEKPDIKYAAKNLRSPNLPIDVYYGMFGLYILSPRVFELLDENIKNNLREDGEFELTSVLHKMHSEHPFFAHEIDGMRFDVGKVDEYFESVSIVNNILKNQ